MTTTPESNSEQEQIVSPETLANTRFSTLYNKVIDEHAVTREPAPGDGNLWVALLPRKPGWMPTKWDDIDNAVSRIHITKTSEWGNADLNTDEVVVVDPDAEDNGKYWSKHFKVGENGRVGVVIDHMRVKPNIDEPPRISTQEIEQAPVELLNEVADEIEAILAQSVTA